MLLKVRISLIPGHGTTGNYQVYGNMLTDIFAFRYAQTPIWHEFSKAEKRLIVQSFAIIGETIAPYYDDDGKELATGKEFWKDIHDRLSVELGQRQLSPHAYSYQTVFQGQQTTVTGSWSIYKVCENWIHADPTAAGEIDEFIKERLSFVEIAFRKREDFIAAINADLPKRILQAKLVPRTGIQLPGNVEDGIRARNRRLNQEFQNAVDELNVRFKQAGCRLHYHNGFIQISDDELFLKEAEQPFWNLVAAPLWGNVDIDMKEAIDRRDSGGRDPAFYAARALESTIKIISDEKGWTHGGEKGAHNYIDNLGKASSGFVERWEADTLKKFFSSVRNPFGHGPGSAEMPRLSPQQTDLAIEHCISWIKSLIKRL